MNSPNFSNLSLIGTGNKSLANECESKVTPSEKCTLKSFEGDRTFKLPPYTESSPPFRGEPLRFSTTQEWEDNAYSYSVQNDAERLTRVDRDFVEQSNVAPKLSSAERTKKCRLVRSLPGGGGSEKGEGTCGREVDADKTG